MSKDIYLYFNYNDITCQFFHNIMFIDEYKKNHKSNIKNKNFFKVNTNKITK